jgi:hypothetical protein
MRGFAYILAFASLLACEGGKGGGVIPCGASQSPCGAGTSCHFSDQQCGDGDVGVCVVDTAACSDIFAPVCGCDGNVYSNPCEAQSVDVDGRGSCDDAPPGRFACGPVFCVTGEAYCRRIVSDVSGFPDDFTCEAFPVSCAADPSCACLEASGTEGCVDQCSDEPDGVLVVCPGG